MTASKEFVPALGWRPLTPFYDIAVRALTRERAWRTTFLAQIAPQPGETILDVGCGTGSLAILLKGAAPQARVVGLDPDVAVLDRAATKAKAAGVEIEWRQGFARDAAGQNIHIDKAVSSLVFHQVPQAEKEAGIRAMVAAVADGGSIHIADFARQNGKLGRALFSIIGLLDGAANTRPNADGALEDIIGSIDPAGATPTGRYRTAVGAISLFRLQPTARKGRLTL